MTPNDTTPVLNEKPWTVNPRDDLRIGKQEFEHFAKGSEDRAKNRVHIIDVRSPKEFSGKDKRDIGATNIEWKHFYTPQGRPDPLIKEKLAALGISPGDRVILVCRSGVRSSAATYALRAIGFTNAQSLTGGLSGY
ncbi:MAG: sulfurtransferase [Bdellovibrionales bacterium]